MRDDLNDLIGELAVPHRAAPAFRALLAAGLEALPTVRAGLRHACADVRLHCCRYLDHFVVPEAMDDLLVALGDPDARVRREAVHALTCDRCKEGVCDLDDRVVLPRAMALLAGDDDPHVRAFAIELVGRWVHTRPEAEAALVRVASEDSSPAVRKKARWLAPGGPIHRRTAPRPPRRAVTRPGSATAGCRPGP